ncbi:LysR substrate-binding domain-containing protein [Bradyrhizobium sp. 2TAF24]|uniref:LysR family transcriptional regulator n=1 Tax=Bradyrhizobium sp. 2TAF24 TaxID=3233011 RepID=UPI003F924C6D
MAQQWLNGSQVEEAIAFAVVAEQGSFAKAALILERDASILSRRVTALEQRLGVRLLERTTRRLALTEAGTSFLARVRAGLGALSEAEAMASSDARGGPRGTLRLALPASFARMWIAPILPAFLARYPDVRIEASLANTYVDLIAGGFDAAVRIGALPDSRLVARRIAGHRRVLCASPAYLERHGMPQEPADLAHHACLGFTGFASHPHWHLVHPSEGRSVTVRTTSALVCDDSEALVQAAVRDAGIMMCTDWLVGRELARGELLPVLDAWTTQDAGAVYAVVPSNQLLPAKTRAFVDWIAESFAPLPPWRLSRQ